MASAPAVVPSGDKIGEAAKALSDASYPFMKDIDWPSDIYLKPLLRADAASCCHSTKSAYKMLMQLRAARALPVWRQCFSQSSTR